MARGLTLIAVLLLFVLLGVNVHYRAVVSEERRSDFIVFYAAGAELLRGGDPYTISHERGWPFVYPPGAAVIFAPFALLPLSAAVVAWYAVSVLALTWAVRRLVQLCDQASGRALGAVVIAVLAVNFGPTISGLQRGQVSALLFGLMMEAVWRLHRGRVGSAGIWLGVATTLKLFPAAMIWPALCGLFRVRKSMMLIVVTMLTTLVLNAAPAAWAGPERAIAFVEKFVERVSATGTGRESDANDVDPRNRDRRELGTVNVLGPVNQSPFAVVGRWLSRDSIPKHEPFALTLANWPLERVRVLTAVGLVAALGVLGWTAFAARPRGARAEIITDGGEARRSLVVWALAMTLAPCLSPIAWHHAFTSLTMLYATTGVLIATEPRVAWRRWLVVALAIAIVGNWLHFGWYEARQAGALLAGTLVLCVATAGWTLSSRGCSARTSPSAGRDPGEIPG